MFEQFDWFKENLYTSINSVSKNLGTIFLPTALKIHNYFNKKEICGQRTQAIDQNVQTWTLQERV